MSYSHSWKPDRRAFTLIELMLVIAILLVLGTVSVTAYMRVKAGADKNSAKLMVDGAVNAVRLYQIALSKYPTNDEGLQALITVPDDEKEAQKWRDGGGPFLTDARIPVDPWNNELKYAVREGADSDLGPPYRVFSYGPDGQEGTDDDISSYEEKTGL
jgi:general secretion pathway protein G